MEAWNSPFFIIPVGELFIGKRILPGTHIFAKLHNPDYLVILSRGIPKDTVIIFGWAATGYRLCMISGYLPACVHTSWLQLRLQGSSSVTMISSILLCSMLSWCSLPVGFIMRDHMCTSGSGDPSI